MKLFHIAAAACLMTLAAHAQTPIQIHVDAAHPTGPYTPAWNYFGADEPNYTYTPDGTKLLRELSEIDTATPVYFRAHNLLTTGDGTPALKWGSTNAYTEEPDGSPVYDWAITDRIFDNFKATHVRPLVEIGFMPEALSPHPTPYQHNFPAGDVYTGWSYPPKDYTKWRALIVAWVAHLHARYGSAVDTWQWEVWNEPDINYFHGSPDEYFKLYDITTGALRQVLPHAFVGGPGVTGGGTNKSFLKLFLAHCDTGLNADSGKPGAPLDFISFHPKGSPKFIDGHVRMGLGDQLARTDTGFRIIAASGKFAHLPIILTETDPEGCAACKGPQNGYRNGALYGVSVAEMLTRSAELAHADGVNLLGGVTWAFEFEDQPWFAGFRELATHGVDKPVLNVFRMFGKLRGEQLPLASTGTIDPSTIAKEGVRTQPDISGLATRKGNSVSVIVWNYQDEDVPAPAAPIALAIDGIPASSIHITQYRMDDQHSNAYTAWLAMGSPQQPTPMQLKELQRQSGLQILEQTNLRKQPKSPATLTTTLPRQGVALYQLTW